MRKDNYYATRNIKDIDRIAEQQVEYIKNNNITYNGILLNEIYYGKLFKKILADLSEN